jgi:hypothetical protein
VSEVEEKFSEMHGRRSLKQRTCEPSLDHLFIAGGAIDFVQEINPTSYLYCGMIRAKFNNKWEKAAPPIDEAPAWLLVRSFAAARAIRPR